MFSVSALGELLIDFTDAGTSAGGQRLFERNAGGAPANVLVALEKLGHKTAFLGKVGCDMHGEFLRATLEEQGIDTRGLISDPDAFTTLAFVALSPDGEREFSFARKPGADTRITADELARDVIADSRVFHVGSLSLTDEPARSATLAALSAAREAGCTLSYDPNYRANLWPSVDAATADLSSLKSLNPACRANRETVASEMPSRAESCWIDMTRNSAGHVATKSMIVRSASV